MANVIVNSCYIKSSQHFINYLEYAGKKLEAQTLVMSDGTKMELKPDEIYDISEDPDFRYIQIEMKDGSIRRFSPEKYSKYIYEKSEQFEQNEVFSSKDYSEDDKTVQKRSPVKYLDYIAHRPSVENNPNLSHGLFSINGAVDIEAAKDSVLENENSIKWSHIISLTREGAEATGYENREAWENLIRAKAYDIGRLYNIPPEHLAIMAAYHDKAHHPHCHLFFYSTANTTKEGCAGFGEGDLAKKSEKLKSIFHNQIFKDDVSYIIEEKNELREEMKNELKKYILEIGKSDYMPDKEIVKAFTDLADSLSDYKGRAFYKYLSPENKQKVCELLRTTVSSDKNLKQIYSKILDNQRASVEMYNDDAEKINNRLNDFEKHFFFPNKNGDMRSLHNIIIKQAMLFNQQICPDSKNDVVRKEEISSFSNEKASENITELPEAPADEIPENEIEESYGIMQSWWNKEYKAARLYLYGNKTVSPDFSVAYTALSEEAARNNAFAIHDLGKMFQNGIGVEKNKTAAQMYFSKALELFSSAELKKGDSYLEYRIGKMHEYGLGTKSDKKEAAEWYSKSVQADENPFAAYALGKFYEQGSGVDKDTKKAFNYFHIAASSEKSPNAYAMYKLGVMYSNGLGTEQNQTEADEWFKKAYTGFKEIEELNNDDYILYKLGNMNHKGIGTEINLDLAEEYYLKAAELNNPHAFYSLGILYSNDEFSGYNIEKAIEYYMLAANAESDIQSFAQYALGRLYLNNENIQNIDKAVQYLKASAALKNQFAQYTLGKLYLQGADISKDINEAIKYFTLAAEQKNQYAQYALGKIYLEDEKVKDIEKAIEFLKASAEQNNPFAQYALGKIYFLGIDLPVDINEAIKYFTLSAEQKNQYAQYALGRIYLENDEFRDINKAVEYLKASAEQKNQFAQYTLGKYYFQNADIFEAIKYFSLSAEQKNPQAQFALGKLFSDGIYIQKDIKQAIHYLTAAADQNNPYAAFSLGKVYASGDENYRIDLSKASEWNCKAYSGFLEMAKEDTDGTILYKLGNMNLKGIGTAQNINQALQFFTASAQKGNQYAQYAIGKLYYEGKWVTQDINTAKENFRASAAQGNTAAQRKLFYISNESDTQIKSSYASSLLLSRLAFAMSNLAMHASVNKQQQEEEEKEQKQQPKFASRNHQRSRARLTVENPMQY